MLNVNVDISQIDGNKGQTRSGKGCFFDMSNVELFREDI